MYIAHRLIQGMVHQIEKQSAKKIVPLPAVGTIKLLSLRLCRHLNLASSSGSDAPRVSTRSLGQPAKHGFSKLITSPEEDTVGL